MYPRALFRVARRFASTTPTSLEDWYHSVSDSVKEEVPLLSSLQQYTNSLPVEVVDGKARKLHENKMYIHHDDIDALANELERNPDARYPAKFMEGPRGYGKTSLVLRGFLESTLRGNPDKKKRDPFQYYVYLAFSGNGGRHYQPSPRTPSTDPYIAHNQGADFIMRCVVDALTNVPWEDGVPRVIPLNEQPVHALFSKKALKEVLVRFDGRVLIHLDEHRKMCDLPNENPKAAEAFTLGAMSIIAQIYRVAVLATDASMPLLPAYHDSMASRVPVTIPSLDIDAAMADIPALSSLQERVHSLAEASKLDGNQRLWNILRFRLALKLRSLPLSKFQASDPEFQDCLVALNTASEPADLTQALTECCRVCAFKIAPPTRNENATKLLCGVPDQSYTELQLEEPNQLVVQGLVSCDLKWLLELSFPDEGGVFNKGRELMVNAVCSNDPRTVHCPLKAAYFWALSTRALYCGILDFVCVGHYRRFLCRKMQPGRIFPSHEAEGNSPDWPYQIEPKTFYYANEGKDDDELVAHPLFDCWFRDENKDVVLCVITSDKFDSVEKAAKLAEWIKSEQARLNRVGRKGAPDLHGAVLAPNAEGKSQIYADKRRIRSRVAIVRGADATKVLGGLAQVLRWM